MNDPRDRLDEFAHAMKRDWDDRARQDAKWFINTLRLQQSDEEFDASGRVEVERLIVPDLWLLARGREPQTMSVLEIGCGAGRMTRHLAALFGTVHGTDVSGEMIAQARQRLADCANVSLYETDGCGFAALPAELVELVFSAYVFQHVPSAAVIRANLDDAYRVLKPGGVMRFQTNGITAFDYEATEKDTWAGATFPEAEIRRFADECGAQLIGITFPGTQYCWTTLRKPVRAASDAPRYVVAPPRIVWQGRADDPHVKEIPTAGHLGYFTLIAAGLALADIDLNSVIVEIDGVAAQPQYVGSLGQNYRDALSAQCAAELDQLTQINQQSPLGIQPETAQVRLLIRSGETTEAVAVQFYEPPPIIPAIVGVRNARDEHTETFTRGVETKFSLLVDRLDRTADPGNIRLQLGARIIKPTYVGFLPGNGLYLVAAPLPADIERGETELSLFFGNLESPRRVLRIV